MRLGLHVSVRNGPVTALRRAAGLGAQTLQIFARHPRRWRGPGWDHDTVTAFRQLRESLGLSPLLIHSAFVPNLSVSEEKSHRRSILHLAEELRRSEALGADAFVIHAGAASPGRTPAEGVERFRDAVREATTLAPGRVSILLENVPGGGRRLGGDFAEVAALLNALPSNRRPGLCFDTGHAWGAGWDLSTPSGIEETAKALDRSVGLSAIRVFHVNDSAAPRGSGLDWHNHLGKGLIGIENLRAFFARADRRDAAYIMETPRDAIDADEKNFETMARGLAGLFDGGPSDKMSPNDLLP